MSAHHHPVIGAKVRFHAALGNRIREYRVASGMSQRQVAAAIEGMSASSLDKYEDGLTAPTAYFVWKLAHLFDCTTDDLMVDPSDEATE